MSYYTKGGVVRIILDDEVRSATRNAHSLDDVMRAAYQRYSGIRGFTEQEFRDVASEVAGVDLNPWFARAVDSTEELVYDDALAWWGLRFTPSTSDDEPTAWLGLELDGANRITRVGYEAPVYEAGVNVGDEVVGIDRWRVADAGWSAMKKRYEPGDAADLLVSRRGELRRVPVVFAIQDESDWTLEVQEDEVAAVRERRRRWLEGS